MTPNWQNSTQPTGKDVLPILSATGQVNPPALPEIHPQRSLCPRRMKARSKELLDRAIAATMAAIEIYNKPNFLYREEAPEMQ